MVNGLRFFYHTMLKRARTTFAIPLSRQRGKLPVILSREEVGRVIAHAPNPKYRTILPTTYAAGLRLNEVLHLRVADIDSRSSSISGGTLIGSPSATTAWWRSRTAP